MKHVHTNNNIGEPTIGCWYDAKNLPEIFKVVAIDKNGAVEIQYFGGDIEEIEHDYWCSLHPDEIAEPEDASAPFELEREDILNLNNEIENDADLDTYLDQLDKDDY